MNPKFHRVDKCKKARRETWHIWSCSQNLADRVRCSLENSVCHEFNLFHYKSVCRKSNVLTWPFVRIISAVRSPITNQTDRNASFGLKTRIFPILITATTSATGGHKRCNFFRFCIPSLENEPWLIFALVAYGRIDAFWYTLAFKLLMQSPCKAPEIETVSLPQFQPFGIRVNPVGHKHRM